MMRTIHLSILLMVLTAAPIGNSLGQTNGKPYLPFGIFLGKIEEGARIFTPVRLLPFEHPESQGHQFPNALQLFGTEFQTTIWLGRLAGYEFGTTLSRYPTDPSPEWPYTNFSQLPDTTVLRSIKPFRRPATDAPIKGLRAVLFVNQEPVCYIVDTRNLTLAERGMSRATSMGLDISRVDFIAGMKKATVYLDGRDTAAVIFTQ